MEIHKHKLNSERKYSTWKNIKTEKSKDYLISIKKKLSKRDNFSLKIVKRLKKLQLPLETKRKKSDFVIKNNFKNNSAKKSVKIILKKILSNAWSNSWYWDNGFINNWKS